MSHNGHCRACHHPVTFADTEDGATVVLERHESSLGPNRFAIWTDDIARPVSASRACLAQEVHLCAGLRARKDSSPVD